jgi:DNA-binding MarR family transcriptional regulator
MLNNPADDISPLDRSGITELLVRIFNKAAAIERDPVDTGDGVLLYTSEVHLIDAAARYPLESMSGLADRLGITKGAISQTAKKLEEKGYLERTKPAGNNKTVFLCLTKAGERAYTWHRAYHAAVYGKIEHELSFKNDRDIRDIVLFLQELERIFDECPEIRQRISGTISQRPEK